MDDKLKRAIDRRMAGAALSEASKARILQEIEQGKDEKSVKAHRIFVATVAVAVATMVAAAAVSISWMGQTFAPAYGEENMTLFEEYGYPVGVSETDNGYTITLDAVMADDYNACVAFTVRRDDGQPIDSDVTKWDFNCVSTLGRSPDGSMFSSPILESRIVDPDPEDNEFQAYTIALTDHPFELDTITVQIEGFGYRNENGNYVQPIIGDWRYHVPYERRSISKQIDAQFASFVRQRGSNNRYTTVKEINLSPLGLQIWTEEQYTTLKATGDRCILVTKNGEEHELKLKSPHANPCGQYGAIFDTLIPLEDVDHIVLYGTEIPVN